MVRRSQLAYNDDMPYLIDGHNLVPHLGLRLDSPDDELALIERLQEYCRLARTTVEVYFDGAPPGALARRKFGAVTAHFVRQGSSADTALEVRMAKLGRAARNWTVVSSDVRVQRAAKAVQAMSIPAEEFAAQVRATRAHRNKPAGQEGENLAARFRICSSYRAYASSPRPFRTSRARSEPSIAITSSPRGNPRTGPAGLIESVNGDPLPANAPTAG